MRTTKKSNKLTIAVLFIIVVLLGAVLAYMLISKGKKTPVESTEASTLAPVEFRPEVIIVPDNGIRTVNIRMVGDVLMHITVINAGEQEEGSYNYDFLFDHVRDLFEAADFSIVNMEGTLGKEPPYTGYPLFRTNEALVDAFVASHIDLAFTSNNHAIDSGIAGLVLTNEILRERNIIPVGTRTEQTKTWTIEKVNDIAIGFTCFTYETVRQDGRIGINGIPLPDEGYGMLDTFSYEQPWFKEDQDRMVERVKQMRAEGAEYIVFSLHWGDEYYSEPNSFQMEIAQTLADAGVDMILATGPHVVQPIKFITSRDGTHDMICYFGLGNFSSDQRFDTANTQGYAEDGIIASVTIEKNADQVQLTKSEYIPFYCYKVFNGDKTFSQPIPIFKGLTNPDLVDGNTNLLEASLERTRSVMDMNVSNNNIQIKEWEQTQ